MDKRLIIGIIIVVAVILGGPLVLSALKGSSKQPGAPTRPEGAPPEQGAAPSVQQTASQSGPFTPDKLRKLRKGMTVQEIDASIGMSGTIMTVDPLGQQLTKTPVEGPHILVPPGTDYYEWRAPDGVVLQVNITQGQAVRAVLWSPDRTNKRLF